MAIPSRDIAIMVYGQLSMTLDDVSEWADFTLRPRKT